MENNKTIYVCDGSIEGLLSSVYKSYYSDDSVQDIIVDGIYQSNFTYNYQSIDTDYENAQKVAYAIKKKISKLTFDNLVQTWLSEMPMCGHHILEYIKLGFKYGNDVNSLLTQANVEYVLNTTRKVGFEVHRFLGILRFSKMQDNTYRSIISPDHNILPLMADHFANRLSTEKFVIYDEKRKDAILCDTGEWFIVKNAEIKETSFCDDEYAFREMWQRYFETIAIKERTNKKLQRSFIPIRYWDNITELKKELN